MATKQLVGKILGALTFHAVLSAVLGGLGCFIYNVGIAELMNKQPIEYLTSWAIMTGIYLIGMVANFFHTKHLNAKAQLEMMKLMEELNTRYLAKQTEDKEW